MDREDIDRLEVLHLKTKLTDLNRPVLMQTEFNSFVQKEKISNATIAKIKKALIKNKVIREVKLKSDGYKDVDRIAVPNLRPSPYHYALSLRNGTYLSHSSAMNLLGLTQQIPKVIYVNKEQRPKTRIMSSLTQDSIDRAFSNQQRRSKYVFKVDKHQIVMLSGKNSNNAGVEVDDNLGYARTCLERTLIDITVRPKYAGGVFKVVEAYQNSIMDIDYRKILELLAILDYKYPYHQSIGFYLERAGAKEEVLKEFSKIGINYNFYLDYSMAEKKLNESWRVFYPPGI